MSKTLDQVTGPKLGALAPLVDQAKDALSRFEAFTREGQEHYETFRPFIVDNNYVFRTDNTRALFGRLEGAGKDLLTFAPADIDWYHYWLEVHLPGLKKWVFPRFDEAEIARPRRVYTYKNLVELFEACTKTMLAASRCGSSETAVKSATPTKTSENASYAQPRFSKAKASRSRTASPCCRRTLPSGV